MSVLLATSIQISSTRQCLWVLQGAQPAPEWSVGILQIQTNGSKTHLCSYSLPNIPLWCKKRQLLTLKHQQLSRRASTCTVTTESRLRKESAKRDSQERPCGWNSMRSSFTMTLGSQLLRKLHRQASSVLIKSKLKKEVSYKASLANLFTK